MGQEKTKSKKGSGARGRSEDKGVAGRAGAVADLLAALAPLTNAQRTAFHRQHAASRCDALGARTKSLGVVKDASDWAPTIHKALAKFPTDLRRYGPARFAWLLECVLALVDARAAQEADGGAAPAAKAALDRARGAARDARRDLVEALETLGAGDAETEAAIARAVAAGGDDEAQAGALAALAGAARGWIGRADAESKALVASVGLTIGEVDSAENAAGELGAAVGSKTLAGRLEFRDSAAVNRAEGRVVCEMRLAMRLFASAHERNKLVPKLTPGPGTRAVLGKHAAAVEDAPADPPPPPAPAPATGAPTG